MPKKLPGGLPKRDNKKLPGGLLMPTKKPTTSRVRVSYGETINTGNYQSKRIDISIERECPRDEEEVTFDQLFDDVLAHYKEFTSSV